MATYPPDNVKKKVKSPPGGTCHLKYIPIGKKTILNESWNRIFLQKLKSFLFKGKKKDRPAAAEGRANMQMERLKRSVQEPGQFEFEEGFFRFFFVSISFSSSEPSGGFHHPSNWIGLRLFSDFFENLKIFRRITNQSSWLFSLGMYRVHVNDSQVQDWANVSWNKKRKPIWNFNQKESETRYPVEPLQ